MTTTEITPTPIEERDALVSRLFDAVVATLEAHAIFLGDRLGFYRALDAIGEATPAELAAWTGTNERYVREWLEQQTVAGILTCADPSRSPEARFYRLPPGRREVLVDRDHPSYFGGTVRLAVGAVSPLAAVMEAYRTGGGVPYADFGPDTREGIAEMNRPMFLHQLASEWFPALPDVHQRLQANPPARVADLGCGTGWSSIAIARAYPNAIVDGFDLDEASIERARRNAIAAGLDGRVTFALRDAADPELAGSYDLVTAFETVHDMADPVRALRTMRRLLAPSGTVLIADERVGETFTGEPDPVERLNYAFSVLHCLPASMADTPSAATGTVMRPDTLRRYAVEAGFRSVEIAPIEHDFWRFYRLVA